MFWSGNFVVRDVLDGRKIKIFMNQWPKNNGFTVFIESEEGRNVVIWTGQYEGAMNVVFNLWNDNL